jgi:hypothetical protein
MSGFKAYRVTAQGKFEPIRLDLLLVGMWLVLLGLVGLAWWGGYKLVMWMLG